MGGFSDGPDTALARQLHARGLVDAGTLRVCLDEVRRRRSGGAPAALAGLLVQRRLVALPELLALTQPQTSPGSPAALPRRFGPYERVRLLGQGGMGAVFEVRHSLSGATFALKTLTQAALLGEGSEERLRFQREAELAVRLAHPNVVRVADYDLGGPIPWLVQELLPGGSLQERLRRGPLSPSEVVGLGLALADALAHAHAQGVIHRDLKPDNVLFDAEGTPKLTDFGLALGADGSSLTQSGMALGTPGYMAPEQVTGLHAHGPATDVYGLGALLYACLAGEPPFQGPLYQVLEAIVEASPAPPSAPPALSRLLLQCLEKDPGERPRDAETVLGELSRLDQGQPRRRRLPLVGAALAGLGAAGLALGLRPEPPARPPGAPAASAALASAGLPALPPAPSGYALDWRLSESEPELVRASAWREPGRLADPLGAEPSEAFLGVASDLGEGRVRVSYGASALRARLGLGLQGLSQGGPEQGLVRETPTGGWLVHVANDSNRVSVLVGGARWLRPSCSLRLGISPVDYSSVVVRFLGSAQVSYSRRSQQLRGGEAAPPLRFDWGSGQRRVTFSPGAALGEQLEIDGVPRALPNLRRPGWGRAAPLQLDLSEVEVLGEGLTLEGECRRPDRPAAAWLPGEAAPRERLALAFSLLEGGPPASGGPWVGWGDPAEGPALWLELDEGALCLRWGARELRRLPLASSPRQGTLFLGRGDDELVFGLRAPEGPELSERLSFPLPLAGPRRAGYGSAAAALRCLEVGRWRGAPDPAWERFEQARDRGQTLAALAGEAPRTRGWRGAWRLHQLLDVDPRTAPELRGPAALSARRAHARAALGDLRAAAEAQAGRARTALQARALLAAVCAGAREEAEGIARELAQDRVAALRALSPLQPHGSQVELRLVQGFNCLGEDPEAALAALSAARQLFEGEELNEVEGRLGLVWHNLARVAPDAPTRQERAQRALETLRRLEERGYAGQTGCETDAGLANVCFLLQRWDEFERYQRRALAHPLPVRHSFRWTQLAQLYERRGRIEGVGEAYLGLAAYLPRYAAPGLGKLLLTRAGELSPGLRAAAALTLDRLSVPGAEWVQLARASALAALSAPDLRQRDLGTYVLRSLGEEAPGPIRHKARPTLTLLEPEVSQPQLEAANAQDLVVGCLARHDPRLRQVFGR